MASRKDRKTAFRTRTVVLTERDELAFSRVLREFCPEVEIGGTPVDALKDRDCPIPNIPHVASEHVIFALPAPSQEKRWRLNSEMGFTVVWPLCPFDLWRSSWNWLDPEKKWAFDLPLLDWGRLTVGFPKGDPEAKKFGMKLLRLVNKVTWKRTGYGLDACRWSQAGGTERRGLGSGHTIDPAEKIELNKYYDDALWDDRLPEKPTGVRIE